MKITIKSILLILPILIFGCQSLGEDLAEIPLSDQNITSSNEIELKKGEKIAIWTKCNIPNAVPNFKIKYLIEENDKQIEFDSLFPISEHIINSEASEEDVVEKNFDDKDTLIHKENFQFELKNKEFIAPKDGKYTFDFKLSSKSESFFDSGFSIILRKQ
ncbi:hypothetical protein FNW52_10880 [Flavobacterium sp. ZT3R18]|uniref:hypothetical protein n=1 Tax=Flavobacterium sp. ZT3R18 TaxID=2594429 RepID=UPI00117B0575|nr:hypothetical protein [Flavobacterium sp. ZT3R18]TRX35536.1 hypothetical protein FNW52_10880 [Flavobacterium sp. ZT3R18]